MERTGTVDKAVDLLFHLHECAGPVGVTALGRALIMPKTLVTPPTFDGALPGITRATVLEAARHLGMETRIRTIGHAELMRADEVFITGSGARMVPVGSLDGVTIGTTQRPVFTRLSAAFTEMSGATRALCAA